MILHVEVLSAMQNEVRVSYLLYWGVNNGFLEALKLYHCQDYDLVAHLEGMECCLGRKATSPSPS